MSPNGWKASRRPARSWIAIPAFLSVERIRLFAGSCGLCQIAGSSARSPRSEEHTSELQSLMRISYAVFCLKKKSDTYHLISQQSTRHYIPPYHCIITPYHTSHQ